MKMSAQEVDAETDARGGRPWRKRFFVLIGSCALAAAAGCGGSDKGSQEQDAGVAVPDSGVSPEDAGPDVDHDAGSRPNPVIECSKDTDCDVDVGEICDLSIHECVDADCATMTCSGGGVCTMEDGYGWCNCPHGFTGLGQNCIQFTDIPEWFGVQWADPWQSEADRTNNAALRFEQGQTEGTSIYGQVYWPGITDAGTAKPQKWEMQLGLTTAASISYPIVASTFEWFDMNFNEACGDCGNNMEWKIAFPTQTEGTFKWILRFSPNDSDWVYGDVTPGFITSANNKAGTATVTKPSSNEQEWTFMVYLDGDNNLGHDDLCMEMCTTYYDYTEEQCRLICGPASMDLAEMQDAMEEAGASSDKINVIVLFDDNSSAPSSGYAPNGKTKLYKVTRSGLQTLSSGSVFSGTEANMADVNTLKKFGVWAVKTYPAKKYALVLWDHGGGWRDGKSGKTHCGGSFGLLNNAGKKNGFRDFSQDETNGGDNMITLANGDYAKALKAISDQAQKKLDLVGFDACLMGMFEVAAATKDYADYLVASSETEPGDGWPYDNFLDLLGKKPAMEASELAKNISSAYIDYYKNNSDYANEVTTMAVYDLSTMGDLTNKLNEFGKALVDTVTVENTADQTKYIKKIKEISGAIQRFAYADHADLKHFAYKIYRATSLPQSLRDKAKAVSDQLVNKTIIAHGANNAADANGMAIFFPVMFNCCADDDGYGYTISTWDEYEGCNDYPYSSFDCSEEGGALYSWKDVLFEEGKINGQYYNAGWSTGWNDFLNTYYRLLLK